MLRVSVSVSLLFAGLCCIAVADQPSAVIPAAHKALLKKHCFECHDRETREGKIDLESLSFDLGSLQTAEVWQKVLGAINAGEMPPADSEPISAAEKAEFLDDLSRKIVVARKLLSDSGGVITMRRLNRREYANTMRDLLHVDVDVDDLPDDANSAGFDTAGSALFFSSDQFEQYLKIARKALDDAIVSGKRPESTVVRRECENAANKVVQNRVNAFKKKQAKIDAFKASGRPPTEFGFIDVARVDFEQGQVNLHKPFVDWYRAHEKSKTGALMVTAFQGAYLDVTTLPRYSGDYVLRVRAGAFPDSAPHRRFLDFGHKGSDGPSGEIVIEGCRQVTGTIDEPRVIEIPLTVTKSRPRHIVLRERQPNSAAAMKSAYRAARAKNGIGPIPAVWIDWVELEGPMVQQWPPASHTAVFFKDENAKRNDKYARQIIERFATKAFRMKRPSPKFVDMLVGQYQSRRDMGEAFDVAIRHPLAIILASPSFLYLSEPNGEAEKRRLSDLELAVRLSYLLWSGPPDQELYDIAHRGELSEPEKLKTQTNRLLDDPRAWEFISGFAHQWLHMERLDLFQFNASLYPSFDDSTKAAARREIYHTIRTLLQENLPVGRLLKSDFVVINDLLAQYYGIDGVLGPEFRRVELPNDSERGGLLGTAAVLAMGSDGERTSPVERGAWIMRKLLHDPPPPAPANVPQLSRFEGESLSARRLQTAHMEEPQCAQCHRKIDPLGFALENFDAAGKWRDKELTHVPTGKRRRTKAVQHDIDPSGILPDGSEFADYFEMRELIARHEDDFARGIVESLIEYGLGRPYGFSDYELAEAIIAETKRDEYRMRSFIHALIQSKPFQTK